MDKLSLTTRSDDGARKKLSNTYRRVAGTKYSIHNGQLLTSTGVDSLDSRLGGGIAIGSVVLIEEDSFSTCSDALLKHLFAEGVVVGHKIFLATNPTDPLRLLKSLPKPVRNEATAARSKSEETMKIAFQYQRLPSLSSEGNASPSSTVYDCSQSIDWETMEKTNPVVFTPKFCADNSVYDQLLSEISSTVSSSGVVVRIGLRSLHSPAWSSRDDPHHNCTQFCRFLYKLRAVLRYSLAVCYVTVPTQLTKSKLVTRIERLCDTVLRLDSFEDDEHERNPVFNSFQGVLSIPKLSLLNSQTRFVPSSKQFGFKIGKRKLVFETLHLPPYFDTSTSDNKAAGCGTATGHNKLDF